MLTLKKKIVSCKSAKEVTDPLPFRGKRAENCSHNLGKALGEGLGHKFSYRRMDVKTVFFVRCRRTYVHNKSKFQLLIK